MLEASLRNTGMSTISWIPIIILIIILLVDYPYSSTKGIRLFDRRLIAGRQLHISAGSLSESLTDTDWGSLTPTDTHTLTPTDTHTLTPTQLYSASTHPPWRHLHISGVSLCKHRLEANLLKTEVMHVRQPLVQRSRFNFKFGQRKINFCHYYYYYSPTE